MGWDILIATIYYLLHIKLAQSLSQFSNLPILRKLNFAELHVRISLMASNSIVGPLLTDLYQLRMAYVYWKVDGCIGVQKVYTFAGWKC